jgi:membrane fusion protein, multidrug efflux system
MGMKHTLKTLMLSSIAGVLLVACGDQQVPSNSPAELAPQVSVAQVISERITEWDEFSGRLQAPETVTLVPRVSGYIKQVNLNEGTLVKAGDLLFKIDPAPFEADVARLRADLQSAVTAAQLASNNYQRGEQLAGQRAMSAELLDNRRAAKQQAEANVASVNAALQKAELDLSYTKITAPIDGRVSYAQITTGNFVTAGQSELTHLVSTDKMYAYFDVDERTYLKYAQLSSAGKRADTRDRQANPVYMTLANNSDHNYAGSVDFVDNAINQQTGTIRVRASFANQDNNLIPGLYAHIKLIGSETYQGILIDEKSIGTDLNNKFVLVVNKDVLEYRAVELGEKINGLRIVNKGLDASDRIVVNGLQRVRPNMQIAPVMVNMASEEQISKLRSEQEVLDQNNLILTAQLDNSTNRS